MDQSNSEQRPHAFNPNEHVMQLKSRGGFKDERITDDHLVCDDPTCPCRNEFEDCIPDEPPTEAEIEAMYSDHTGG